MDTLSNLESGLLGSLIGSIIGGVVVLSGIYWEHRNNVRLAEAETRKKIRGILQAIYYELEILGEVYKQQAGKVLANVPDGDFFNQKFFLTEKYFIVYPNNSDIVGQIADADLVKSIVVTYNLANFLLEAFRINNDLLQQFRELKNLAVDTKQTDSSKAFIVQMSFSRQQGALKKMLIENTNSLKAISKSLEDSTRDLLRRIGLYILNHSRN